jgi:hypothetical protein
MPTLFRRDPSPPRQPPLYPGDLEGAIQDTLAVLADIDYAYDERRSAIWMWSGPHVETLLKQVDELHRREREPYVRRLEELHGRAMSLTLFGARH